jgi:DNA adenine methylase
VTTIQPLLTWPGGKRKLVPQLRALWQEHTHRRLVEPFCGSLAIALGLQPTRALLNDINASLISFYRLIKDGQMIDLPMDVSESCFSAYRDRFNALVHAGQADSREAAQLLYYLSKTGFNGVCRFNRQGEYNVPKGDKKPTFVRDFPAYRRLFQSWLFTCGDFEQLVLDPDDFVYADPPYDGTFDDYSKEGFVWSDQVRLAEWLATHPGPVIASNASTERIKKLYEDLGFTIRSVTMPRSVSRDGNQRKPVKEMLATKNLKGVHEQVSLFGEVSV